LNLNPNETRMLKWGLWIQPSQTGQLNVSARGTIIAGGITGQDQKMVRVPLAQIYPIVFLPGLGATEPPSYDQDNSHLWLANIVGHYNELYETLQKMGYEMDRTLFLFPYDWLRGNMESARHLRDDRLVPSARIAADVPWVFGSGNPAAVRFDLIGHSTGNLVARAYIQGPHWGNNVRRYVSIAGPHQGVTKSYAMFEGVAPDLEAIDLLAFSKYAPERAQAAGYGRVECFPGRGCFYILDDAEKYQFVHDPIKGIPILPEFFPTYPDRNYLANTNLNPPTPSGDFPFGRMANPLLEAQSAVTGSKQDAVRGLMQGKVFDPYLGNPNIQARAVPSGFQTTYYGLNTAQAIQRMSDRLGGIAQNVCVIYGTGTNTLQRYEVASPQNRAPYWFNGRREQDDPRPPGHGDGDNIVLDISGNPVGIWPIQGVERVGVEHEKITGDHDTVKEVGRCLTHFVLPSGLLPGASIRSDTASASLTDRAIIISASSVVQLTLTDPRGRRLGYNPSGGRDWTEIPNSQYTRDSKTMQRYLILNAPEVGNYSLTVTGEENGKYTVMATFSEGTKSANLFIETDIISRNQRRVKLFTAPATAAQVPAPPSVVVGGDLSGVVGAPVTFAGSFTDPNPRDTHKIVWDLGDGTTAVGSLNPTHIYRRTGTYTVTLTVTDSFGFAVSKTHKVDIAASPAATTPTRAPTPTPSATPARR
jgi:PKD repeat protein